MCFSSTPTPSLAGRGVRRPTRRRLPLSGYALETCRRRRPLQRMSIGAAKALAFVSLLSYTGQAAR
ncbi:unnamed protein product [Amoebophrya sp. A120]|nr:unnamed protein product [Amoebophrya sp. A120]|eukprot:GSA120T00008238001.1